MKLRPANIFRAILHARGYRLEPIRTKATPDTLPSDPFLAQQSIINRLGISEPTIFDVGANKGDTVALYRNLLPDSAFHCFEPFPETLKALHTRYDDDQRVTIIPKAVSTEPGTTSFFVNQSAATNSLLPRPGESGRYYPETAKPKDEIQVQTIDLDSYCNQQSIDRINILKLDIQGAELLALQGAKGLLCNHRIDLIYAEIQFVELYKDAAQFDGLWGMLRNYGYTLFDVYDLHRSAGGHLLYGDALFLSPKCKQDILDQLLIDD